MKERVLVVEDNVYYRDSLVAVLQTDFDVVHVSTLRDALEEIGRSQPAAVILDLSLPDSMYEQTLTSVKTMAKAAVLVLSGLDDPDFMARQIKNAASGYLVKHKDDRPDILLREVRKAIDSYRVVHGLNLATRAVS